jgi:hypothetical protein
MVNYKTIFPASDDFSELIRTTQALIHDNALLQIEVDPRPRKADHSVDVRSANGSSDPGVIDDYETQASAVAADEIPRRASLFLGHHFAAQRFRDMMIDQGLRSPHSQKGIDFR